MCPSLVQVSQVKRYTTEKKIRARTKKVQTTHEMTIKQIDFYDDCTRWVGWKSWKPNPNSIYSHMQGKIFFSYCFYCYHYFYYCKKKCHTFISRFVSLHFDYCDDDDDDGSLHTTWSQSTLWIFVRFNSNFVFVLFLFLPIRVECKITDDTQNKCKWVAMILCHYRNVTTAFFNNDNGFLSIFMSDLPAFFSYMHLHTHKNQKCSIYKNNLKFGWMKIFFFHEIMLSGLFSWQTHTTKILSKKNRI